MFCKGPGSRLPMLPLTTLTASIDSAINQLLTRSAILMLIFRLKHNEKSHTQEQINYDLDRPINWKYRGHAFIKVPCPFGAMCNGPGNQ